jgi:DNA-binding transcriptional ArsR family regulator
MFDRRAGFSPGPSPCEWSADPVCSAIIARHPDYELDDVLMVEDPKQLRALAETSRARIVGLLRERAASTTELAVALGSPKGTVGHHVKVLEEARLIRVVRTRKVRALTESYYGRVARLYVMKSDESMPKELRGGALSALMLRHAADELIASGDEGDAGGLVNVKLTDADRRRFERRLNRLVADMHGADDPTGERHILGYALFRSRPGLPPSDHA